MQPCHTWLVFSNSSLEKWIKILPGIMKNILKPPSAGLFNLLKRPCCEPYRSTGKSLPIIRWHPMKMYFRSSKSRKKFQLRRVYAVLPRNWPARNVTSRSKTAFRSAPMPSIMLKPVWAAISPSRRPRRSSRRTRKRVWSCSHLIHRKSAACAAAAGIAAACCVR